MKISEKLMIQFLSLAVFSAVFFTAETVRASEIQIAGNQPVAVVDPEEAVEDDSGYAEEESPAEAFEASGAIQPVAPTPKQNVAAPKVDLKAGEFAAGVCGGVAADMPAPAKCVGTVRTPGGLREIFFVSKLSNEHIMIYDRKNNKYVLADVRGGNGRKVGAANISSDGKHLVVAVALTGVDVYDLQTMKRVASGSISGNSSINKVEFTKGKSIKVTAKNGKKANLKLVNKNGKAKLVKVPAKKPAAPVVSPRGGAIRR